MAPALAAAVRVIGLAVAAFAIAAAPAGAAPEHAARHALAKFGEPLFGPTTPHFPYVNPEAPKGGRIRLAELGSFDSLNAIPLRGTWPRTIGLVISPLMIGSGDELAVAYGALAASVTIGPELAWAEFALRPEARYHDGVPVTADDVVFAWEAIQAHGRPFLRAFLSAVTAVRALGPDRLRIEVATRGDMKPLLNAATVLGPEPRHWWTAEGRDIGKTTLEPVLGSGPYRIAKVDPGRSITYQRIADWWGERLMVYRGRHNFDEVVVDYYRDDDVMFEAFKAGAYDFRVEYRAQRWVTGYQADPDRPDAIETRAVPLEEPLGAQGFRFNARRAKFADPRVREAIGYLFDFDWIRQNILHGQYQRVKSNFPNSAFGASGPPTAAELAVLAPFSDRIGDPRVLTDAFEPPRGPVRRRLRRALALFRSAGWEVRDGRLTETATGTPMDIEFLTVTPTMERVVLPYLRSLERAGITGSLRIVDPAQFEVRTDDFDFDVVTANFNFFSPPGTELRSFFGSAAAAVPGSANYSGIADPVVDALIEHVLAADDLDTMMTASRALDRVLLWGFYMIPHWYNAETWLAHRPIFGWPTRAAKYDIVFRNNNFPSTWWHAAAVRTGDTDR